LGLENVSEGLLDPISDIAPIPTVAKDVAFEQRDPQIKVFLSNNRLRSFPVSLFNVEHLTVLSLRANRLGRIPPAIAKLKNLETLNIAQNYLRFLPGELLDLLRHGSKLHSLNFAPNKFWQPEDAASNAQGADDYERLTYSSLPPPAETETSSWSGLTTRIHSRTPVHFTSSTQQTYSRFTLPPLDSRTQQDKPLEWEPFTELATPRELGAELNSRAATSKVVNPRGARSLFELALRACAASAQADRIPAWLREGAEEEGWPAYFAPAVQEAVDIHREGGARCAVCGRATLMPLARWIEFRQIGRTTVAVDEAGERVEKFTGLGGVGEGLPVPFLRVGCSWTCVPVRVEGKVEEG